jgi:hypothetical protein
MSFFGNGVFVADHVDVAEAQAFDEILHEFRVCDRFESLSRLWRQDLSEFRTREFFAPAWASMMFSPI